MQSFDSISSEADASEVYGGSRASFRKGRGFPWKTVSAALMLFAVGSILLFFGVGYLRTEFDRGVAMIVLGSITFLPGSYATFLIYGVWKKWKGYKWEHIPSYDD